MAAASQMEAFGRDSLIVNQQEKKMFVCLFVCCYSMAILFFFFAFAQESEKNTQYDTSSENHRKSLLKK